MSPSSGGNKERTLRILGAPTESEDKVSVGIKRGSKAQLSPSWIREGFPRALVLRLLLWSEKFSRWKRRRTF